MEDVLLILEDMGAKNIVFDESKDGSYSTTLIFEYKGKEVWLGGCWFNTQEAGMDGFVEDITQG